MKGALLMKKFYLSIIAILLVSILIFSGCDLFGDDEEDDNNDDIENTLTLTGTITHVFVPGSPTIWTSDYLSAGNNYILVNENDGSTLDTDTGGNADLYLSYGTPIAGMLIDPTLYNYTSSNGHAQWQRFYLFHWYSFESNVDLCRLSYYF